MRNAFLLINCLSALAAPLAAADLPNILFMLSDDHSYPYVSAYGDANVNTPTLNRLAAEGMKFHRFFTSCPQCVPSRAAYLTGRSPVAARITRFSSPLARDVITFPELLREKAGYFTGVCGRTFHLDGAAPGRVDEPIRAIYDKHRLRTFADRVDFLNTCPDDQVALKLWKEAGVRVIPGRYLARQQDDGSNPGEGYLRCAMVQDAETTAEALHRIVRVLT